MGDRRGVSEVLSFALVFAIITSSVALVYVVGLPGLEGQRDAERVSNAERAFDILADNMADIHERGAPSRATEIKLAKAQVSITDDYEMNVSAVNGSGTYVGEARTTYRPVRYQSQDSTIVYENGAVIRSDEGSGAVMKREPQMLFGEERTVIPYVQTRSRDAQSVGSDSVVLVRAVGSTSSLMFERRDDPPYEVTLNVTTTETRAEVWKSYFESEIDWMDPNCSITNGGTNVECTFETRQLYVSVSRIDVNLS